MGPKGSVTRCSLWRQFMRKDVPTSFGGHLWCTPIASFTGDCNLLTWVTLVSHEAATRLHMPPCFTDSCNLRKWITLQSLTPRSSPCLWGVAEHVPWHAFCCAHL